MTLDAGVFSAFSVCFRVFSVIQTIVCRPAGACFCVASIFYTPFAPLVLKTVWDGKPSPTSEEADSTRRVPATRTDQINGMNAIKAFPGETPSLRKSLRNALPRYLFNLHLVCGITAQTGSLCYKEQNLLTTSSGFSAPSEILTERNSHGRHSESACYQDGRASVAT